MEINSYPINTKDSSSLKLVEAAGLPASFPSSSKSLIPAPEKKLAPALTVELSDEAIMQVNKLKVRDTQLRQHERAHHAASNGVDVSSASFTYQRGPNGVNYAVSGDVRIDTSPGHTPEETLARAEMISDVALAPSDPSATDRSVAAKAQYMAMQARSDLMRAGVDEINKAESASTTKNMIDKDNPKSGHIDTYT